MRRLFSFSTPVLGTLAAVGTKFAAGAARRELGSGRVTRAWFTAAVSWERTSAESGALPPEVPFISSSSTAARGLNSGAAADIFDALGGCCSSAALEARLFGGLEERCDMVRM